MIDLHTHVLPAIDDGPASLDESVELARMLVAAGVHTVAATPHVRDDYPTDAAQIERGVVAVQEAVDDAGIALRFCLARSSRSSSSTSAC